ncbi:MAG: hypothetical protein ABID61_02345 [Candidatus Micrarchaeota archaeon]
MGKILQILKEEFPKIELRKLHTSISDWFIVAGTVSLFGIILLGILPMMVFAPHAPWTLKLTVYIGACGLAVFTAIWFYRVSIRLEENNIK